MANAISSTAKVLTAIYDTLRVVESCEKLFEAQDAHQACFLEKASVVNRLILLGFTIAEVGMVIGGKKSDALAALKAIELVPRVLDLPLTINLEATKSDGSLRSVIGLVEKGVIASGASILRVSAQSHCYIEQHYMQMSPEELKNAKRPVYELKWNGSEHEQVLVGHKPVDLEECKDNFAKEGRNGMVAAAVAYWAQSDFVETVMGEQRAPLYERLHNFFRRAPGQQAVQENPHVDVEALEVDFQRYPRIPNVLHNDDVFRRFICPITHDPIRDPVRDPTNNQTLYERSAIVNWLRVHRNSPMTRRPLEIDQLIEAPGIKAVIDRRLDHHRQGLLNYIEEHLQDPIPEPDQLVIDQNQ